MPGPGSLGETPPPPHPPPQSRASRREQTVQTALSPGFRPRSEDSWVEVSSQPSSSSLSSANEEIVTEGLRVQHDSNLRRRRRSRTTGSLRMAVNRRNRGASSSQEEYEESESESDRVLSSSNEEIRQSLLQAEFRRNNTDLVSVSSGDEDSQGYDDDDDENSTAVNYPRTSNLRFTPQPNAFTHPPTAQATRSQSSPYVPGRPSARSSSQRHSYSTQQHTPFNAISPSHQADHDAALRASLSTLLSCAAAARGLSKPEQTQPRANSGPSNRVEPATIRMVPESAVFGSETPSKPSRSSTTSSSSPQVLAAEKPKKRSSSPKQGRSSSKDRALKKARRVATTDDISPTLFTWVLSAGVVVLFSAISFSAGYVVGKENGRAEILGQLGSSAGDAGKCGREALEGVGRSGMGLKRLRLSTVSAAVR